MVHTASGSSGRDQFKWKKTKLFRQGLDEATQTPDTASAPLRGCHPGNARTNEKSEPRWLTNQKPGKCHQAEADIEGESGLKISHYETFETSPAN